MGREHLSHSQCASADAFVAYIVFIHSRFWMQGKLATDCDGLVEHGKWQEPEGTLSVALTAYILIETQEILCDVDIEMHGQPSLTH